MRFLQQQRYLVIGSAACAVAAVSVVYSAVWSLKGGRIPSRRKEPKRVLITGAAGMLLSCCEGSANCPGRTSGRMLQPGSSTTMTTHQACYVCPSDMLQFMSQVRLLML